MTKCGRNIFVDMDGVLFDFDRHYTALTGIQLDWKDFNSRKVNSEPRAGARRQKWWEALEPHPTFYRDLPLMPGALDLWAYLQPYEPCILSAESSHIPQSRQQKIESCAEHLQLTSDRVIIVADRVDKPRYCHPGDLLLDDQFRNIDDWNIEGGYGILFRSAEQAIADVRKVLGD